MFLNLLLDPKVFLALLVAFACASPLIGLAVRGKCSSTPFHRRLWICGVLSGPGVLVAWGIHNLVLRFVGFDSVFSVLILLGLACALGLGVGTWLRRA